MTTETAFDLSQYAGLVNNDLLEMSEDARESYCRARLIQGDSSLEKDADLNKTVRYLGGIGFSAEMATPEMLQQGKIVTLDSGDWVTFPEVDIVVLTSARIRRLFRDIDGKVKVVCGTNADGAHARGWRGVNCSGCEFSPKNAVTKEDKKDACQGSIPILVYVPQFDHTAIMEMRGGSYMATGDWLQQLALMGKKFAQLPAIQEKSPGLARVNTHFFHTRLSASGYTESNDGNKFQTLRFAKAEAPYNWAELVNSPDVIKKVEKILEEMKEPWAQQYQIEHEAHPALLVAGAAPTAPERQLTGSTQVEKVTVAAPAPAPAPTPAAVTAEQPLAVSTIEMEDDEPDLGF